MKPLLLFTLLLCTFAISQTPDPTPVDARITGTVVDADGKPVSDATVSVVQENFSSITDAYPIQIKTASDGHFDSGPTLKHALYYLYARKEKDGYPDRSSPFYRVVDFEPQTAQLFGARPEAKVDIKLGDKAGVLTGKVIDGDTDQPLDAWVSLVNMDMNGVPNTLNGKSVETKGGTFRELVPENTDVYVHVRVHSGDPAWSHFDVKVSLQPGEERSLGIRLYKNGTGY
jgi:hypothetical protein